METVCKRAGIRVRMPALFDDPEKNKKRPEIRCAFAFVLLLTEQQPCLHGEPCG